MVDSVLEVDSCGWRGEVYASLEVRDDDGRRAAETCRSSIVSSCASRSVPGRCGGFESRAEVTKKSTLSKFQPYLDDSGVMRVGGVSAVATCRLKLNIPFSSASTSCQKS